MRAHVLLNLLNKVRKRAFYLFFATSLINSIKHENITLSYYYQGSIFCTLPTQYAPIIIIVLR